MSTDSPELVAAKRLLDHLKLRGFHFPRTDSGADAPWSDTGSPTTGRTPS